MNTFLRMAVLATALCSGTQAALADEIVSETRPVDARATKINLDGLVSLKLKQGPTASLTLYGEKRYLQKVTAIQNGDTLRIDSDIKGTRMNKTELRAELTLPNLRELASNGVGSAEVNGFSGDDLRVALDGAGSVKVASEYKNLSAKLGGVGSMTIKVGSSESVDLNLRGAGQIEISGQSKVLHANLGGVGSLDAQQLKADSVDVNLTGLGSASVYAKNAANMKLSGMGSATVYGKPATRNSSARGMGSVSWQ